MADGNPRAVIGDNRPPAFDQAALDAAKDLSAEFFDAGEVWCNLKKIDTAEQASALVDMVAGMRATIDKIETAMRGEKKPHDDAGKEVKAAFDPLTKRLEDQVSTMKDMVTDWLKATGNERIESASGIARTMSLRTTKHVRILKPSTLFMAFMDDPEITKALEKVATRAARAKDAPDTIPGCEIYTTQEAV